MDEQEPPGDVPSTPAGTEPSAPPLPPPTAPPPPPGPGAGPRRLRRDTANAMIGGVAAGFARALGVDVVLVRLSFVLATVFGGGFGLVLYLAAWLIMPVGDDLEAGGPVPRSAWPGADPGRGPAFWTGAVLVTIGAVMLLEVVLSPLAARFGGFSMREVALPLMLISLGILVYRAGRGAQLLAPGVRDVDAVEERVERWGEDLEQRAEAWEARSATLRAQRSRSRVAPVTLGLALLTLGGVWLLAALDVGDLTLRRALAAALLVVGAGLILGAFLGRGRGLVGTGLVLAAVVLVATLVPQLPGGLAAVTVTDDGVLVQGDRPVLERPGTLDELAATYEFGAGRVTLDLRDLDRDALARAGTTTVRVELGVGELRIRLPEHVTADVAVELGIGRIDVAGATSSGLGLDRDVRLAGTTPEDGRLVLDVQQGIGSLEVTR